MTKKLILALLIACPAFAQTPWSPFLDTSRAYDWTHVNLTVPAYTTACSGSPPTLLTGTGHEAANTSAINAAIATCDATHNVVNLPAGTYHTNGWTTGSKSKVVVRGASTNTDGVTGTYVYTDASVGVCGGYPSAHVCVAGNSLYAQSTNVNPGGGNYCAWTAGFSQGTASVTLNSCGFTPTTGMMLVLDQADNTTDPGGIFRCSSFNSTVSPNCTQKGNVNLNPVGRVVSGTLFSEQWLTKITTVSGSGTGPFTVGLQDAIPFNDVTGAFTTGAWAPSSQVANVGIEDMTIDQTGDTSTNIGILAIWVDGFWMQNVRSIGGAVVNHLDLISDYNPIVQHNYFYGSNHSGSSSYCVEALEVSQMVVQNNIMHNTTSPDIKDGVTGSITAYNFTPYINFGGPPASGIYLQGLYASHNSGSSFNLLEGNSTTNLIADNIWGTAYGITGFRNHLTGWQSTSGLTWSSQTNSAIFNSFTRGFNMVGNVMGEPGYHTLYGCQATSTSATATQAVAGGSLTASTPCANVNKAIYELGTSDNTGLGNCTNPPTCDAKTASTLMRWGNYDTVNASNIWNSTEASPGAVSGINANFTTSYFNTLSQVLPNSLYLTSKPSWFVTPFPAIGPDITGGTTGICTSGTYNGSRVTASGQCAGGTFSASSWAGHANANPAMTCYLAVMSGPPDGSGSALAYDSAACYAAAPPITGSGSTNIFLIL